MIIDAHQHFWKYEPTKHSWIDDTMAVIRKDFMPAKLKKVYLENNIDGCVAVQADQTTLENDFLIDLASKNNFIKGIVGWVDFRADNINEVLDHYSKIKIIKGFRHVVQGEPDHNFLLRSNFLNGIAQLEQYNFTYDILVFPHQLGAVLEFVKKFPKINFVIDHIAKPYIKDGFYDGWANLMLAIGAQQNVYCKLSGMVTEADYKTWTSETIKPYMQLVLKAFGADRLLFGSDWPVCLVAGNYKRVKELVTDFISQLSAEDQEKILGLNAVKFYNL
ncbi:amidohydrolase family protein [Cellulophaga lytica]|uniref:Amidohydrolase 2 n=1 Tax=Cellulophaga lytica (strain ATCC 23178 / DSM 7489 / JCM 8516 / NBRC 14961 / NCIMB 1423 / VKM B-1433 / Cy l20) TaxID=867900 RepID=F0RIC7_CELLC|nr:amidohydrolase family protein [Cellulophaga lytica]ADY28253.1 amidohydrolase 2 [Cellulophaga lytica DSM 7489]MDO6853737.1 amidohydrolase family protein [Cellulophaga lytica]WQG77566.1 amidohydrolase family protein [Cellulophaga lytica]